MSSSLAERDQALINSMIGLPSWEARYQSLIDRGRKLPTYPAEMRSDDYLIKACQSRTWLALDIAREPHEGLYFWADSEAAIVKGLMSLLLAVVNSASPQEIISYQLQFPVALGFQQHLSLSRTNGFRGAWQQLQYYAFAAQLRNSS